MKKLSHVCCFYVFSNACAIAGGHKKDVVDTAAANEQFSTLVTAVLVWFRPLNQRAHSLFLRQQMMPKGTVENLLKQRIKTNWQLSSSIRR